MYIPRLRTIETVVDSIREEDPESSISIYLLRTLVGKNEISSCPVGNKLIVNLDEILHYFTNTGGKAQ